MRKWIRENYKIEERNYDQDLHCFAIVQDGKEQIIYPDNIEDMKNIIKDLNAGESVEGWEDGNGNTIVI